MRGSISKPIGYLFVLIWQLISCGGHDPRLGAVIEAPFLPFVKTFESECKCKVFDIPITFQEIDIAHAGECWNYVWLLNSYSEVAIDADWWKRARDDMREQLILHELGHCVLHREHNNALVGTYPLSLMYSVAGQIGSTYYAENRQNYFDELFQRNAFEPRKRP